jgi:hypothetical protein
MTHIHSLSPSEPTPFTGRPINGSLLLKVSEAATALRISRSSIYRLFESGELAWVQNRRVGPGHLGGDSPLHRRSHRSGVIAIHRWLNAAFRRRSDASSLPSVPVTSLSSGIS